MSGGSVFTTVGRDEIVNIIKDKLSYFKFGEGGFLLSGEATEVIDNGAIGGENTYDYTVTGGDFNIIGVDQLNKEFKIDGDFVLYFPALTKIKIEGSTGNDGSYSVVAATLVTGDTYIEVTEAIPDSSIDGVLYVSHLPIAKGPTDDATHYPLVVEERTPVGVLVQSLSDTTGTGVLSGNGTGTVNYKTGVVHVVFNSNVSSGNKVNIVFKYHDRRKDASLGQGLTDLEAASSPISPDGLHELFSYQKSFGGGTPPDPLSVITFRGVGYGTIRCNLRLREWDGIDDGRGNTYGGTPYYFEAGIFSSNGVMVAYMTFDKERHSGSVVISHTCDFVV